jgi:hypothetical protein
MDPAFMPVSRVTRLISHRGAVWIRADRARYTRSQTVRRKVIHPRPRYNRWVLNAYWDTDCSEAVR